MVYTERKKKGNKTYYYRTLSVRDGTNVTKKRIYLGSNLTRVELILKENAANYNLDPFLSLLDVKQMKILDKIKTNYKQLPKITNNQRYEAFCSLFANNSTGIEGNTFTLLETAQLLFENTTPAKPLREINEILNHKEAFDFMLKYNSDISREFILKLHEKMMRNTSTQDKANQIGKYRTVQVYIRGVKWLPTPANNVAFEMTQLLKWYTANKNKYHPLIIASYFHCQFEYIHPFFDGNGRVGRLLLNFILHKNGFPKINIPLECKQQYYHSLELAQVHSKYDDFIDFMIELLQNEKVAY